MLTFYLYMDKTHCKASERNREMTSAIENRIACLNNLNFFNANCCEGKYQMPILKKQSCCPDRLLDFSSSLKSRDYNAGVHFFIDDYRFERLWKNPSIYIPILSRFAFVLTPDFSVMQNMPTALQVWNVFRSRLIGYVMQRVGISVIPSVSWSDESSFEFCFDGIEKGGVVAVSSVGVIKNHNALVFFKKGLHEMFRRITPRKLLFYGTPIPFEHNDIEIIYFNNTTTAWKTQKNM